MSRKREEPLDPAVLGRLNEDHWKPRKKKAEGDRRHYLTTNKGTAPGLPQPDEYNPGVVWWFSKRIWLGHKPKARYLAGKTPPEKTRLWKLFDVLAYSPDRWHSVSEIHERVFGNGLGGASRAERKRAVLRVRRLVSKLKRRMGQYGTDEHAILVAKSCNRQPGYMAILLANQKHKNGEEPWPELRGTDREDRLSLKEDRQENGEPLGVVYWGDKSVRLGEITYLRKLFHYLADQPGRFRPVSEIEEFVFGTNCDTSVGVNMVVFRLATCCGLRASEIAGLILGDVQVDNSRPSIRIRREIGKGHKARKLPLHWDAGTLADLVEWKRFRREKGAADDDKFVCSQHSDAFGNTLDRRNLRKRFKACCKVLGRERQAGLTIHDGRHSFVSHALHGGRSIVEVRAAAGHSSLATTSIYAHLVDTNDEVGNLFDFV